MRDDIKIVSSKRQGDVGDVTSPRAPSGFHTETRLNRDEVLESISILPSAKSINLDGVQGMFASAVPETSERVLDSLPSTYKESLLEPEIIVEEKEEYVYSVPAGYEHLVPRLVEKKVDGDHVEELETRLVKLKDRSWNGIDKLMRGICKKHGISPKKLHDDFKSKHNQIPDEWVEKQSPTPKPKSEVEKLAEQIKVKKPKEITEEVKGDIRDQKIANLEQQLRDLRKITLETAQGTIVHGLGHMSTGSGEVNLSRMDDVDVRNISDGSTLVWDSELQKWIPSGSGGVQIPGGNQDLTDRIEGIEDALLSLQKFVQEHTDSDNLHPDSPTAHSHFGLIDVLTYETATNTLGARAVNFENDDIAFIVSEQSVDLDHFEHIINDSNLLLIEVEGSTQFEVSDHEHLPDFVAFEKYTDVYGISRDIDFNDSTVILLRLQHSDGILDQPFGDELIVELESNTLTSPSQTATIFGVEVSTDTSTATEFNWNDDVNLISPEGIINPQDLSSAGEGTFLGLEDSLDGHDNVTIPSQSEVSQEFATASKFFDEEPGGDINRFRVTTDSSRGVYKLDEISQPAIQVPRGDILEFDLTAIQDRSEFTIFAEGSELTTEMERFPTLLRFDTSKLNTSTNKAYYRHRSKRGKGWLIVITDN